MQRPISCRKKGSNQRRKAAALLTKLHGKWLSRERILPIKSVPVAINILAVATTKQAS